MSILSRGSGSSLLLGLCVLLLVNGNNVAWLLCVDPFGLCLLHSTFVLVTFLLLCWCGNVATCVSLFVNLMVVAILFSGSGTCLHGYLFGCLVFYSVAAPQLALCVKSLFYHLDPS